MNFTHRAVFTMCSHTFTLFWLRNTSVIFETYQLSYRVFVLLSSGDLFIFFSKSFLFSYFCVFLTLVLYLSTLPLYRVQVIDMCVLQWICFCVCFSLTEELGNVVTWGLPGVHIMRNRFYPDDLFSHSKVVSFNCVQSSAWVSCF